MLLRTVAPVVVKPDMVSKKASVTLSTVPYIRKGSMPNKENNTHDRATTMKVSRICSLPGLLIRPMQYRNSPTAPVRAAVSRK